MSDHIATFGAYDEILIVAERIISIEGVPETRGGHVVVRDGRPHYIASMVGLDTGTSMQLPHPPQEVAQRRRDAILRGSMLPS